MRIKMVEGLDLKMVKKHEEELRRKELAKHRDYLKRLKERHER
jgi:hypothetical protein